MIVLLISLALCGIFIGGRENPLDFPDPETAKFLALYTVLFVIADK